MSVKTLYYGTIESQTNDSVMSLQFEDGLIRVNLNDVSIYLDRMTAIRLSKNLRSEIYKLNQSEREANDE